MLIPLDDLCRRYSFRLNGVLHLGGNLGQEADVYDGLGARRVVWVEAIPSVYKNLCVHLASFPNQTALCACVSDVDGEEVTFHIANNQGQSSSFLELGTHAQEHPTVKYVSDLQLRTVRVDSLLQRHGIEIDEGWFLNADLQGAELLALKGMGDFLHRFDYAYIEVNKAHLYKGCPLVGEVDTYLAQFGFEGVETKWTGNGWGDRFYRKN